MDDIVLLDQFKAYYTPYHRGGDVPLIFKSKSDPELLRTLQVSKQVIKRMLGSSVTALELPNIATQSKVNLNLRKEDPDTLVLIVQGTVFQTGDKIFIPVKPQRFIGMTDIVFPAISLATGHAQNVPANSVWPTGNNLLTVTNPSPATGGSDARDGDWAVLEAVFFLARFFIQHREFSERLFESEWIHNLQDRLHQKFDPDLPPAVYRHITGLISDSRVASDFMPAVD